jgi:hypothetical protein
MHSRGWVHGDIKPLNLMRVGRAWHLIDLDAAAELEKPALAKFTTAYLPPEAFALDADGTVQVRTDTNGAVAVDMWALGMTLYDMCVGFGDRVFTRLDKYENLISEAEKRRLMDWTDRFKDDVLSRIEHEPARKLVAWLLSKDPEDRPLAMREVLNHPFLNATRAEREKAIDIDTVRSMSRSMASVEAAAVATAAAVVPMAATLAKVDETVTNIDKTTTETLTRVKGLARLVTEFPRSTVPRRVLILPERTAAALTADDAAVEAKSGKTAALLALAKKAWADVSEAANPYVTYRVFLCCDGATHDSELQDVACECGDRPLHDGYPMSLPGPRLRKLAPLLKTGLKYLKYGLMAGKAVTGLPVPTCFGTDVFAGATDALALVDGFCDVFDDKAVQAKVAKVTTAVDGVETDAAKAAALDNATRAEGGTSRDVFAAAYDTLGAMLETPTDDSVTWLKDRNSSLLWQVADTLAPGVCAINATDMECRMGGQVSYVPFHASVCVFMLTTTVFVHDSDLEEQAAKKAVADAKADAKTAAAAVAADAKRAKKKIKAAKQKLLKYRARKSKSLLLLGLAPPAPAPDAASSDAADGIDRIDLDAMDQT